MIKNASTATPPAQRSCLLVGRQRDCCCWPSCCSWATRLSSLRGEVWSIARASARMCLLALPLVQPHPAPRFHQRRLCRRVRSLQTVSEGGVLRLGEPVGSVCLQCRKLPYQP